MTLPNPVERAANVAPPRGFGVLELLLGGDAWALQPPDTAVEILNDAATIAAGERSAIALA